MTKRGFIIAERDGMFGRRYYAVRVISPTDVLETADHFTRLGAWIAGLRGKWLAPGGEYR